MKFWEWLKRLFNRKEVSDFVNEKPNKEIELSVIDRDLKPNRDEPEIISRDDVIQLEKQKEDQLKKTKEAEKLAIEKKRLEAIAEAKQKATEEEKRIARENAIALKLRREAKAKKAKAAIVAKAKKELNDKEEAIRLSEKNDESIDEDIYGDFDEAYIENESELSSDFNLGVSEDFDKGRYQSTNLTSVKVKYRKQVSAMINSMPATSGVYYIFRNGKICYIGKAKNLKRRMAEHLTGAIASLRVDREMHKHFDEFTFRFKGVPIDKITTFEISEIRKYDPMYNGHSNENRNPGIYSVRRDVAHTNEITVKMVSIKNITFSVTGSFWTPDGIRISRNIITSILEDLGGTWSKASRASEIWLVGKGAGLKQEKIDSDDIVIDSPFKIKGFKEQYEKEYK